MNRTRPRHAIALVTLLISAAALSGCGQTGALYMPGDAAPNEVGSNTDNENSGEDSDNGRDEQP